MYTLVSASVLALDLARHPSGAAVADVVDRALVLDAGETCATGPSVVDLERAGARERLLIAARRAPRMEAALRAVSASLGTRAGAVAAHALRAALVGGLDDLVRLLTAELEERAGHPREVVDVVVDRAVAAWVQDDDTAYAADAATLTAPWTALVGELPPLPPSSGSGPALLALLEAVARADRTAWSALDAAHTAQHAGLSWSASMHTASRAAVEEDRVVDVARWQLSAVRAIAAAGHGRDGRSPGAAMSVVGGVQALTLRDALAPEVADRLLAPCRSVLGLCV